MKKCIMLFMIFICILGLVSCYNGNTEEMSNVDKFLTDVQTVQVSFYTGADVHEWELTQDEIKEWIVWLNALTLEQMSQEDLNIPSDNHESGSRYIFEINTEEMCIQYVDKGDFGVYLLAEDVWYKVINPKEPFNRF